MDKLPDNLTHEEELMWIDFHRTKIMKKLFDLNKQLKYVRIKNFEVEIERVGKGKAQNYTPWWMFWKKRNGNVEK